MTPNLLESLYMHLGRPVWFWPIVFFIVFIVAPLGASSLESL